jgi:hypothetical protein
MTHTEVKQFCQETRQLAAQLNNYADKWRALPDGDKPPFTKQERRRAGRALMALEIAVKRIV